MSFGGTCFNFGCWLWGMIAGKLITHAVVYPHNRHRRRVLHGGEEKPACTLGLCTVHCVRRPQTAFELLHLNCWCPWCVSVCMHVCMCACVRVHARACVCACTHLCACVCVHACVRMWGRGWKWGRRWVVEGCLLSWNGSDLFFLNFSVFPNIFWIWFI